MSTWHAPGQRREGWQVVTRAEGLAVCFGFEEQKVLHKVCTPTAGGGQQEVTMSTWHASGRWREGRRNNPHPP